MLISSSSSSPVVDQEKLTQYMAAIVAALSPAMLRAIEMSTARQDHAGEQAMTHTGTAQNLARQESKEDVRSESMYGDRSMDYEEEVLEGGRVVKRYEDGTVRIENLESGVIQEERRDGRLLVSLPGGRLLYQDFPGEPLIVYDLNNPDTQPSLAQVGWATFPGSTTPGLVYSFDDASGKNIVDTTTLRYYRMKPAAA